MENNNFEARLKEWSEEEKVAFRKNFIDFESNLDSFLKNYSESDEDTIKDYQQINVMLRNFEPFFDSHYPDGKKINNNEKKLVFVQFITDATEILEKELPSSKTIAFAKVSCELITNMFTVLERMSTLSLFPSPSSKDKELIENVEEYCGRLKDMPNVYDNNFHKLEVKIEDIADIVMHPSKFFEIDTAGQNNTAIHLDEVI
jgi:hypothetical protein